jgi:antitoxin (DNA-binding transcriptional repressor) of toxin-antitoxin stability system
MVIMKYSDRPDPPPMTVAETPLTMLELRQNAADIMNGLDKGINYKLTYRGKTVGKLVPADKSGEGIPKDDAIHHLEDFISDGPVGKLTNEDIDSVLYGI